MKMLFFKNFFSDSYVQVSFNVWKPSCPPFFILKFSHLIMSIFSIFSFVIAKRCFLLLSILYFYRSITMYVTVLPISSDTYYCSPKSNTTSTFVVIKRAFTLFSGMGLSINNKQIYCGDSIFSGHTTILLLVYLVFDKCNKFIFKFFDCIPLKPDFNCKLFKLFSRHSKKAEILKLARCAQHNFWHSFSSSKSFSLHDWYCNRLLHHLKTFLDLPLTLQASRELIRTRNKKWVVDIDI